MIRRILKWNVPVDDHEHPVGSGTVVLVACQGDPAVVQVWTDELVNDTAGLLPSTTARVYGTGQDLPPYAALAVETAPWRPWPWHIARWEERWLARIHQPLPLRIDGAAYHRRRKARTRRNR